MTSGPLEANNPAMPTDRKSGALRHRVTIKRPPRKGDPDSRDSRGRRSGKWVEIGRANCEIITLSGTEAELAKQLVATATHQVRLRVRRSFTLTSKHRFEFRGRVFHIGHVDDEDQLGVWWIATVTEEVA